MQKLDPPTGTDLQQVWVLEDGSEERIVADLAGGNITAEEADWLRQFRDKGYVVWERLIDPADIDALVRDVGDIAKHPGHFVSTDHGDRARSDSPTRRSGRSRASSTCT